MKPSITLYLEHFDLICQRCYVLKGGVVREGGYLKLILPQ